MEPLNLMVSLSFYGSDERNRADIKRARRARRTATASSAERVLRTGTAHRALHWLRTVSAR
ncbi:hypothetical protein EV646_102565 [Kribbella antiqua]|uniref:Uncharacterized protein n=1 Tax=Kribbella antiqua TaxID=2512217 RepID=A0A4R2IXG6_9ACTN|nr:hypothetical protein [Kribbella antiqua]TCO50491.1 hypothetical protein EV646_102565 [Kribbella antiqua]